MRHNWWDGKNLSQDRAFSNQASVCLQAQWAALPQPRPTAWVQVPLGLRPIGPEDKNDHGTQFAISACRGNEACVPARVTLIDATTLAFLAAS